MENKFLSNRIRLTLFLCVFVLALQASLDGLLAEKLQLEHEVEELTKELVQLREQVVLLNTTMWVCTWVCCNVILWPVG